MANSGYLRFSGFKRYTSDEQLCYRLADAGSGESNILQLVTSCVQGRIQGGGAPGARAPP